MATYLKGFLIIAIVIINSVLAIVQEGNAEKALGVIARYEQADGNCYPRKAK